MEARFDQVWEVLDAQVAAGRFPGYVAAIRTDGRAETHVGGRMALERGSPPMAEDTLFRIASVTKPIGGALALSLAEDGVLSLDDPIESWLPEMAEPRVLVAPDAPLDRTTAARRPITVRHLLTLTSGWGAVLEPSPLQQAMLERGIHPGPLPPRVRAEEFIASLAGLPLAFQPGGGWLYHTGIDVLGVLVSRATGRPLSELLAERIFEPLGMTSTAHWTAHVDRLATAYRPGPNGLEVSDPPEGEHAAPPLFEALGSGLVATAGDIMRFFTAMADGGSPVLTAQSVALMTADALTEEQRRQALPIVGLGASWGLATGVDVEADEPWMAVGRWGWTGGTGASAFVDPARGNVAALMTQREMTHALDRNDAFWTTLAGASQGPTGSSGPS
jgi:CubicO group peptidase (beta-lactamase class C family)